MIFSLMVELIGFYVRKWGLSTIWGIFGCEDVKLCQKPNLLVR
jgi:hypothetical protein